MLSNVEFQPQWLQNPPTAECAKTSFCGAHFTIKPLAFISLTKPSGKNSIHSNPLTEPGRTTHRNGWLLLARPHAISVDTFSSILAMLPKLTYNTDLGACLSSHEMQLVSSSRKLVLEGVGIILCNGPTVKTGTW
ncbi:hypothetical protein HanRHA438_Chr11g0505161 [Helianthus annuus]|nr:hypothetical protein HanRHA438_Chr11g0505161 [Helianthus annuus]